MPSFLKELRRRNVIKVGLAYLAVAWLADLMAEQSVATRYYGKLDCDAVRTRWK